MYCVNCGSPMGDTEKFCTNCGAGVGTAPSTVVQVNTLEYGSEKYKPIGAWGYIGYSLLFSIPVIGLVLVLIFSFSDKKINRRNYARSILLGIVIAIVLGIAMFYLLQFGLSDFSDEIGTLTEYLV